MERTDDDLVPVDVAVQTNMPVDDNVRHHIDQCCRTHPAIRSSEAAAHNSQLPAHGAACVSDTVNGRKPAARNSIMRA